MKHYYYSIYSKEYLYKGIILYNSMEKFDKDFTFYLICMDDSSVKLLKGMELKNMEVISIKDIESGDPELYSIKSTRSNKTYAWATKPSAALYILKRHQAVEHLIWLDGDTCFLGDPIAIYNEWKDASILLTPELFTDSHAYLGDIYGKYNTGFIGYRRDETGFKCLEYFREKMIEWKFDKKDEYRWNDQIYAADWPERFDNVGISATVSFNLTPFILYRFNSEQNEYVTCKEDGCYIKDTKIVLYHYMGLKYYDGNIFDLCEYWMKFDRATIELLYKPYMKKCREVVNMINHNIPGFYDSIAASSRYIGNYYNKTVNTLEGAYNFCTIADENTLANVIVLYDSLLKHSNDLVFWICCTDEASYYALTEIKLSKAVIINTRNFEDDKLIKIRSTTSSAAYLKALKLIFIEYIIKNNVNVDKLIYLDPDIFVLENPQAIFDKWSSEDIIKFEYNSLNSNEVVLNTCEEHVMGFANTRKTLNIISNVIYWWLDNTAKGVDEQNPVDFSRLTIYNNVTACKLPIKLYHRDMQFIQSKTKFKKIKALYSRKLISAEQLINNRSKLV